MKFGRRYKQLCREQSVVSCCETAYVSLSNSGNGFLKFLTAPIVLQFVDGRSCSSVVLLCICNSFELAPEVFLFSIKNGCNSSSSE